MTEEANEIVEELDNMMAAVNGQDVGQKRFQMFEVLRFIVEKPYEFSDREIPKVENRVKELKDLNGYMYKLVQEFLTSSSTLEKERKLDKIANHFKSGLS